LNRQDIPTYPSCQGHFVPRSTFDRQYARLTREAAKIRTEGLDFREMETGARVRYFDPAYALPEKEALWADLQAFRGHGFLSFVVPHLDPAVLARLHAQLARSGAHGVLRTSAGRPVTVELEVTTTPANQAEVWGIVARGLAAV